MEKVTIGKGNLLGKGVYANKDFEQGEIVIEYNLESLTEEEFQKLPESEKLFVHTHHGKKYLYSEPERYVNHSLNPNTKQDLMNKCDIAIRKIKNGEMITTNAIRDDV